MERVVIDCGMIEDRAGLHAALAQALDFPAWYGKNLDALHDCLTSLGRDTALVLQNWSAAESLLGPYGVRAAKVMTHAAGENPRLTVEFC